MSKNKTMNVPDSPSIVPTHCRARIRYPRNQGTFILPVKKDWKEDADWLKKTWSLAKVRDISAKGIGLVVKHPLYCGASLAIELRCTKGCFVRTLLARVIHVTSQEDGKWIVGCEFIEALGYDELKVLV